MRRCAILATVGVLLGVAPASSSAEEGPAVQEARDRFLRGVDLFRRGDYEAALADFERAYELAPHYAVLYNIGRVRSELRRYPEAVGALETYLEEGGDEIAADRRAEVERELRRLRQLVARVTISVEGPSAAVVYVDGVEAGPWPSDEPLVVGAGRRTIEVRADGYLPFRRDVTIAGGTTVAVEAPLTIVEATTGAVFVSVSVPGATVSVDGEAVGTTPLDSPITTTPGRHVIEISRPGYAEQGRTVAVEAGQLATLEVDLRPAEDLPALLSGELSLELSEEDAEVFVDGIPYEGQRVPIGPHVLEVRRGGFLDWSRSIDLRPGDPLEIEATLLPTEAFLSRYQARVRRWRIAAWSTLAAGLAILGATSGLYVWASFRDRDFNDEDDYLDEQSDRLSQGLSTAELTDSELDARYEANNDLGHELEAWSIGLAVSMGVGAAVTAAAVALFIVSPNPRRYADLAFAPTPGGLSLALTMPIPHL